MSERAAHSMPPSDPDPPVPEDRRNTAPQTRARYDYQDECIALAILEHLAEDLEGVFIEHATDLLLIPTSGLPELISIKHREPHHSGGAQWTWSSLKKDRVLIDLYEAWLSSGKSCTTAFISNVGMGGPAQMLWKVARGRGPGIVDTVVQRLSRELGVAQREARDFLSSFSMPQHPLPRRNEITDVGVRRTADYLSANGRDSKHASECYLSLVERIRVAGTDEPHSKRSDHRTIASTIRTAASIDATLRTRRRFLSAQEIHALLLRRAEALETLELPDSAHPNWEKDPLFTGRENELSELIRLLRPGSLSSVSPVVIHGMSGCGKTSLAVQFAALQKESFPKTLILDGTSRASLVAALNAITGNPARLKTGLEGIEGPVTPALPGNSSTLLIIDGVADKAILRGIIPRNSPCRVIVTSTIHHIDDGYTHFPLHVWQRIESISYVVKGIQDASADQADRLADAMEDHPLAIVQAVNYCRTVRISISEYLDRLRKDPIEVLKKGSASGHPLSVVRTVELAYDAVRRSNKAAVQLLNLLAFLGPEPLPLSIFDDETVRPFLLEASRPIEYSRRGVFRRRRKSDKDIEWGGYISDETGMNARISLSNPMTRDSAVEELASYALIQVDKGHVTAHSITQRIVRSKLSDPAPWIEAGISLCIGPLAESDDDDLTSQRCRSEKFQLMIGHAESVLSRALDSGFNGPAIIGLAIELSHARCSFGDERGALTLSERALEIVRDSYARGRTTIGVVFQARLACATALRLLGDEVGAISMARENIDLVKPLNNPAALIHQYAWLGLSVAHFARRDLAEEILEQLPDPLTNSSWPERIHPGELVFALHVRTQVLHLVGRFEEAHAVNRRALETLELEKSGVDSSLSLALQSDAALIARSTNDPRTRVKNVRSMLRTLENEYPDRKDRIYAECLISAADAELDLQDYKRAQQLLNKVETIVMDHFGNESDTYTAFLAIRGRCKVTAISFKGGNVRPAIADLTESIRRITESRNKSLLSDMPAALINLAQAYAMTGDEERAMSAARRALEIDEQLFGPEHAETQIDRQVLAGIPQTVQLARILKRWWNR